MIRPEALNVLRLPVTPKGRRWLREAVVLLRGWTFPNGERIEFFDWDRLAECGDLEQSRCPQVADEAPALQRRRG